MRQALANYYMVLGQKELVGVVALKEKLLLSFGIVCIVFGAIGICAVGVAYYYTDSALNELPNDIERLYLVTSQTANDTAAGLVNASISMLTARLELRKISVPVLLPVTDTAESLGNTARSMMQVRDDVAMVSEYLRELKGILLDEISSIRLTAQITFGWIGVLHALFIVIGVSILRIRKSLLSGINMNKT